jgi:hypothetical protein
VTNWVRQSWRVSARVVGSGVSAAVVVLPVRVTTGLRGMTTLDPTAHDVVAVTASRVRTAHVVVAVSVVVSRVPHDVVTLSVMD